MSLDEALNTFIDFYEQTDIDGCCKSNDSDMLLVQYGGPYSWSPKLICRYRFMKNTNRPEGVISSFQAAWNAHAMNALGNLFDHDATFVNRFGHYVRGRSEIVALHVPIHETIYRDSKLENELIDVKFVSENAVVMHFWSRLTVGVAHPAGPHQVDTLILAVLTLKNDVWLIQALENVTLTNPRTGENILRG